MTETIFYPEGGGQPADRGEIVGKKGKLTVTHNRMHNGEVIHEGKLEGVIKPKEEIEARIDWDLRFDHMRWHSAGHVIHEVVRELIPILIPVRGDHGRHAYIEYEGTINPKLGQTIEKRSNMLIAEDRSLHTEFVTHEELTRRASWIPPKLPKHKPLRILQIEGYPPIPDGGTQVKSTQEVGFIKIIGIEQSGPLVRVYYTVSDETISVKKSSPSPELTTSGLTLTLDHFRSLLLELQQKLEDHINKVSFDDLEPLHIQYFGSHGQATSMIRKLKELTKEDRKSAGLLVNEFKRASAELFQKRRQTLASQQTGEWFDVTSPGMKLPEGHLHIVTQAIIEITRIFERLGFSRVRHPEVDWDWYAFESLNMPPHHPARDEWETFFIEYPGKPFPGHSGGRRPIESQTDPYAIHQHNKRGNIVLTPHTSNGQVREMEKGQLPIRMINIAKCYRRQSDVSHVPMFHQFEGLYIDKDVSIGDLKGVFDFFVKHFYGSERKTRLRPFHFQFTEPSFEVDIVCGVCLGKGCKLCKDGWLELGGAGMVHPEVLKNGGIDPDKWNGFAFGMGVERTYMMKSGTQLDDIRLLYSNDLRFLEQF